MMTGKCDKCETCEYQADLISSAEEAICPDCMKGSEYVETLIDRLKREKIEIQKCNKLLAEVNLNNAGKIAELEKKLEKMECCGNCDWWSGRICTNSEWCIRVKDKNDMCVNDLWTPTTIANI